MPRASAEKKHQEQKTSADALTSFHATVHNQTETLQQISRSNLEEKNTVIAQIIKLLIDNAAIIDNAVFLEILAQLDPYDCATLLNHISKDFVNQVIADPLLRDARAPKNQLIKILSQICLLSDEQQENVDDSGFIQITINKLNFLTTLQNKDTLIRTKLDLFLIIATFPVNHRLQALEIIARHLTEDHFELLLLDPHTLIALAELIHIDASDLTVKIFRQYKELLHAATETRVINPTTSPALQICTTLYQTHVLPLAEQAKPIVTQAAQTAWDHRESIARASFNAVLGYTAPLAMATKCIVEGAYSVMQSSEASATSESTSTSTSSATRRSSV